MTRAHSPRRRTGASTVRSTSRMTAWFADYHPNSNTDMSVGPRGARFDLAPIVAFCLTFALVLFLPQILNDSDTLWQIRTGEWILTHHAIPATDPFSFTAGDRPWFAHEWLAETLMALAYRAGGTQNGMAGIMVLAAIASGLTAALLLHHMRRFLPGIYAVLGLIVALSNAAPSMLARPHLLAWPCLVAWCAGLVTARANRTAPSVALLPVMLIWVNLHGSFMIGLLLAGTFLIEALLDRGINHRRVFLAWSSFVLAAGTVALLNPDGLAGVLFPIHMLQHAESRLDRRVGANRFRPHPTAGTDDPCWSRVRPVRQGPFATGSAADPFGSDSRRADPCTQRAASGHRRRSDPGRAAWRQSWPRACRGTHPDMASS